MPGLTTNNPVTSEATNSTSISGSAVNDSANTEQLNGVVDMARYALDDPAFQAECRRSLDESGVLVLPRFLLPDAVDAIQQEGKAQQSLAFYTQGQHTAYLKPKDPALPDTHPRNYQVTSSKGCITTDQIPAASALHVLYKASPVHRFLCAVLGEQALYEYADSLSSINLHYASEGQELGWHFDNSSFAITLLIQKPAGGGVFEYVSNVRDADAGDMNYALTGQVLKGEVTPEQLSMEEGTLVLFRGRNSIHRVTPVEGDTTRLLVVLAYNTEPGVALSESARMTFYGRLGDLQV